MPSTTPLPLIGNDLVINEDSCNLSCTYCLTGQSNLKEGHSLKLIFDPPKRDDYSPTTDLGRRINTVAGRLHGRFDLPLLKVTGGEIFLVRGIMDFLEEQSAHYEVLVIQTNGVLVNEEQLARLRSFGNVVLQISLDSHLYTGNSYRVQSESLHAKVLRTIGRILESGLPVEIYGVLNDRSITELCEFAGWLGGFDNPPTFFPFPVRGPDSETFKVRPDQIGHIEELVRRYDEFADILPPRPYFDRLLSFYREGKRTFRCHLPRLVVSTFSDGVVTPCPNIWFSDMGNVLSDEAEGVLDKLGSSGLYQALLAPRPRLSACHGCFTPWDTLSMYFESEITLDELCAAPTYAPPRIRGMIEQAKADYLAGADV
ncbi:radical SAM protein [Streptomyces sp. BE303]|uniref:radical SAM protein n=1 Tax=Streptomyces sp. BE303 TaxID=3002528 RepID=UPI002E75EB3E|nr:radical SAM protein [Streptomyces sp. BE303]MED7953440.1 radical SAM protein [Streptomyces sp. BE303]